MMLWLSTDFYPHTWDHVVKITLKEVSSNRKNNNKKKKKKKKSNHSYHSDGVIE